LDAKNRKATIAAFNKGNRTDTKQINNKELSSLPLQ
jgi:hypothetical protein